MSAENSNDTSWVDFFKDNFTILLLIIIPIWRFIDKLFEYRSKKDKEFIKEVIKDSMATYKEDLDRLREKQSKDFQTLLDKIYEKNPK